MRHLINKIRSAISLPIEKGDEILTGHWLNHKEKVRSIGKDKHGQPTVNGRPLLRVRLPKLMSAVSPANAWIHPDGTIEDVGLHEDRVWAEMSAADRQEYEGEDGQRISGWALNRGWIRISYASGNLHAELGPAATPAAARRLRDLLQQAIRDDMEVLVDLDDASASPAKIQSLTATNKIELGKLLRQLLAKFGSKTAGFGQNNFWISSAGELLEVPPNLSHGEYAVSYILKDRNYSHYPFDVVYDRAFDKGWVRAVGSGQSMNLQFNDHATSKAKATAKDLAADTLALDGQVYIDYQGQTYQATNRMELGQALRQTGLVTAGYNSYGDYEPEGGWIDPDGRFHDVYHTEADETNPRKYRGLTHPQWAADNVLYEKYKDVNKYALPTRQIWQEMFDLGWIRETSMAPGEIGFQLSSQAAAPAVEAMRQRMVDALAGDRTIYMELDGQTHTATNKLELGALLRQLNQAEPVMAGKSGTSWSDLPDESKSDIIANLIAEVPYLANEWNPNTIKEWLDDADFQVPMHDAPVEPLYAQGQQSHGLSERNAEHIKGLLDTEGELDPIIVDGQRFVDGFHRLTAYHEAGRQTIPVLDIHQLLQTDWPGFFDGRTNIKTAGAPGPQYGWVIDGGELVQLPLPDAPEIMSHGRYVAYRFPDDVSALGFELDQIKAQEFDDLDVDVQEVRQLGLNQGWARVTSTAYEVDIEFTPLITGQALATVKQLCQDAIAEGQELVVDADGGVHTAKNKVQLGEVLRKLQRYGATRQTDSPEFRAWFGDSKVVDDQGQPLVVYHGTTKEFKAFDSNAESASNAYASGFGLWFTADPNVANIFTKGRIPSEDQPNVIPVYLSVQNPYVVDTYEDLTTAAFKGQFTKATHRKALNFKNKLISEGHDGIIIRKSATEYMPERMDIVAFDPSQIKSAIGNTGAFDPANPDITAAKKDLTYTPEFMGWFGDSKVRDAAGNPLKVYHGSKEKGIKQFVTDGTEIGAHFGTAGQAETFSAGEGQLYEVYLRIENPLELQDQGQFDPGTVAAQLEDLGLMSAEDAMYVYNGMTDNHIELSDLTRTVQQAILDAGYDGVSYLNTREGEGQSYIVFDPSQIKAVKNSGAFDPANPDITAGKITQETNYWVLPDGQIKEVDDHREYLSNHMTDEEINRYYPSEENSWKAEDSYLWAFDRGWARMGDAPERFFVQFTNQISAAALSAVKDYIRSAVKQGMDIQVDVSGKEYVITDKSSMGEFFRTLTAAKKPQVFLGGENLDITASKTAVTLPESKDEVTYDSQEVFDYLNSLHLSGWEHAEFQDPEWVVDQHAWYVLKDVSLDDPKIKWADRPGIYSELPTEFPPIVISHDGYIIDGAHRAASARRRGDSTIKAFVGVKKEAKLSTKKPEVFLGGETKTDWRSDIIDEFADTLKLIDPVDPDWKPEENIYDELADALSADEVIFFKGGDGTAGEKQVLDAADKPYEEFRDLDDLADHLEKLSAKPKAPPAPPPEVQGTQVVDSAGQPQLMYHGTATTGGETRQFDLFPEMRVTETPSNELGIFFARYENEADAYAEAAAASGIGEDRHIVAAYLDVKNPYRTTVEKFYKMTEGKTSEQIAALRERLIRKGHDGIFVGEDGDVAVFDPLQIIRPTTQKQVAKTAEHDYDIEQDYERDDRPGKKVKDIVERTMTEINAALPEYGMTGNAEAHFVSDDSAFDALGVFINGTSSRPILMVNAQGILRAAKQYHVDLQEAVASTLWHEIGHAIQESRGEPFDEDQAEDFARYKMFLDRSDPLMLKKNKKKKSDLEVIQSVLKTAIHPTTPKVYHGTTAELGRQIQADGWIKPRNATGQDQWSDSFTTGGNPSNPDLVYTTLEWPDAQQYAAEVCRKNDTKSAALVELEPDWSAVVPDEDVIFEYVYHGRPEDGALARKIWEAYAGVKDLSVEQAVRLVSEPADDESSYEVSDDAMAEDMKNTVQRLLPTLSEDELEQLTPVTAAFSKPLQVLSVDFFEVGQALKTAAAGFQMGWISPDGEFINIGLEHHVPWAYNVLQNHPKYQDKYATTPQNEFADDEIYKDIMALGYLRVLNGNFQVSYTRTRAAVSTLFSMIKYAFDAGEDIYVDLAEESFKIPAGDPVKYGEVMRQLRPALEIVSAITKVGQYDQGCLMVDVPDDLRRHLLKELAPQIPQELLAAEKEETTGGLETETHCTLLFGVEACDETTAAIKKFFTKPLVIKSGTTLGYFDNEETACYVPVESEGLDKLHYALREALPNKQREGEYKPHITLAYLTAGSRLPDLKIKPFEWQVTKVVISKPDGTKEDVYVEGLEPEQPAVEVLSSAKKYKTSELPAAAKAEAYATMPDGPDEYNVLWQLTEIDPGEYAPDILDSTEYDENFMGHVEELQADIKENGLREPVVIGPAGIEGNHRLVACYLNGMPTIPAWVYEYVDDEDPALEVASAVADEWFDAIDRAADRLSKPRELRATITRADADEFIAQFNRAGTGKVQARLVGSIATKGQSEHDIDIMVEPLDLEWADSQMERFEGTAPFYYDIMEAVGAEYRFQTPETSEFLWHGIVIDVQEPLE